MIHFPVLGSRDPAHRYFVAEATARHVTELLPRVRLEDRAGWRASSGQRVEDLLPKCLGLAVMSWSFLVDNEVMSIFGIAPCQEDETIGFPYFVCSDGLDEHAEAFMTRLQEMKGSLLPEYFSYLLNFVDARNVAALRFLRRLGFTLHSPQPFGVAGMSFRKITLGAMHA